MTTLFSFWRAMYHLSNSSLLDDRCSVSLELKRNLLIVFGEQEHLFLLTFELRQIIPLSYCAPP